MGAENWGGIGGLPDIKTEPAEFQRQLELVLNQHEQKLNRGFAVDPANLPFHKFYNVEAVEDLPGSNVFAGQVATVGGLLYSYDGSAWQQYSVNIANIEHWDFNPVADVSALSAAGGSLSTTYSFTPTRTGHALFILSAKFQVNGGVSIWTGHSAIGTIGAKLNYTSADGSAISTLTDIYALPVSDLTEKSFILYGQKIGSPTGSITEIKLGLIYL